MKSDDAMKQRVEGSFVIWWREKVEPVMNGDKGWRVICGTLRAVARKGYMAGFAMGRRIGRGEA